MDIFRRVDDDDDVDDVVIDVTVDDDNDDTPDAAVWCINGVPNKSVNWLSGCNKLVFVRIVLLNLLFDDVAVEPWCELLIGAVFDDINDDDDDEFLSLFNNVVDVAVNGDDDRNNSSKFHTKITGKK